MKIVKIEICNFRKYKGLNVVNLDSSSDKNITIISGRNGYGKTTFLMSLVWCLYGKHMGSVDDLYRKEINSSGGYRKYISNSLNIKSERNGEQEFYVKLSISGVEVDGTPTGQLDIKRSFHKHSDNDTLEILENGKKFELIDRLYSERNDDGAEIFIREFLLPIEIAKFFLFDAEKVVSSITESSKLGQRKQLSQAYAEVIGIKKFEDLRNSLETIRDTYRKQSAKPQDEKRLNEIEYNIKNIEINIRKATKDIEDKNLDLEEKKAERDEIQEKLIDAGQTMTIDELNILRQEKDNEEEATTIALLELKSYYDLIPFILSGNLLAELYEQVQKEMDSKQILSSHQDVSKKIDQILTEIDNSRENLDAVVPIKIRNFYEEQIIKAIRTHFLPSIESDENEPIQEYHGFSEIEYRDFTSLYSEVRSKFKSDFDLVRNRYTDHKNKLHRIRRKISEAEKSQESELNAHLRVQMQKIREDITKLEIEIDRFHEDIEKYKNDKDQLSRDRKLVREKIDADRHITAKDEVVSNSISILKKFTSRYKDEKKKSLSSGIKNELDKLLHKADFVSNVEVRISNSEDDVDIILYDEFKQQIRRESLSMGERQMYASALLKALIEESDKEFPVFIDSPLQKFDTFHARNILEHFYPFVADQVVILPLIGKELTEGEYTLIEDRIANAYLIQNHDAYSSSLEKIHPSELFNHIQDDSN